MNTIVEKIRAEVERLNTIQLKRIQEGDLVDAEPYGKNEAYNNVLSILSDLEKSEKPMNLQPVDLDDAISNWQGIEAFPEGCGITPLPKAMKIVDKTARHFYELGRQSKPRNCEGLEEEYKNYVENDPVYSKLANGIVGLSIARHFAQWGAEHLKK